MTDQLVALAVELGGHDPTRSEIVAIAAVAFDEAGDGCGIARHGEHDSESHEWCSEG